MSDTVSRPKLGGINVKDYWLTLSANHRRGVVIFGSVLGVVLFLSFVTGENNAPKSRRVAATERNILTDTDTRSIGIDALNAKVKLVDADNDRLVKDMNRMSADIKDMKRRKGNDADMTREVAILKSQLKVLTDKAKTIGWAVDDIKEGYYQVPGVEIQRNIPVASKVNKKRYLTEDDITITVPVKKTINVEKGLNTDPNYYFRTAPNRKNSPAPIAGAPNLKTGAQAGGGVQIFTTESISSEVLDVEKNEEIYMPAGSILTGVLLNGLDAPTGRSAKKDPFPVLVRIQKEALLPNLNSADIKECFATLSGYGEMSSERAYLRGEKFSCITVDGGVIEEDLPAYAVGEDGKAGIRGRLVTKAGALLAKTGLAGFAAGVAEAFGSSPVPVISTTPGSGALFQDNYSSSAVQHGVSKGASSALGRLADYYMDMAEQIFPVIEIDAARQIDIVLTNGFLLKIKNKATVLARSKR